MPPSEDEIYRAAVRRLAELAEADEELREATASTADFSFLRRRGRSSIELAQAAFERYARRPCFGVRAPEEASFRTMTYGEVWERVRALAAGLHRSKALKAGDLVGVLGHPSPEWLIADLACLYLGAVAVPLQVSSREEELAHIAREAGLTCVFTDATQLDAVRSAAGSIVKTVVSMNGEASARTREDATHPRVRAMKEIEAQGREVGTVPFVEADGASPVSVLYTSGSTGRPKGVVWTESRWCRTLRRPLDRAPMPVITVGYLPLAHSAGRINAYLAMMVGGATYFVAKSDMSTLFDDVRLVRPTSMTLVPRVSTMVYQEFQSRLVRCGARYASAAAMLDDPLAQPIFAELRETPFGGRLRYVPVGAAPTPPEVVAFLERCLDLSVVNAYGSTEVGTVAVNGRVVTGVAYRLVDRPELGYARADQPYPRGELAVKSANATPGYYKDTAASAGLRDAEGYVLTGDVFEERAPGHIVWIDRKSDVVRLAQGEFVNVSRLEGLFAAGSPFIEQIYLYASPMRSYALAVVVPSPEQRRPSGVSDEPELKRLLRSELERVAETAKLRGYEVPRDFLVEEAPFTKENGLLTEANKPRRPRLKERYGARLEELYAAIETRQAGALASADGERTYRERVLAIVATALGLDVADVDPARRFAQLGGDSLGAVRLAALIEQHCGIKLPVATILAPGATVARIIEAVQAAGARVGTRSIETLHGATAEWARASDLRIARLLDEASIRDARDLPALPRARSVLLTGASGFLGRFVLLELLERADAGDDLDVVCVVRASDDGDARARLTASFGRGDLGRRFDELAKSARLTVASGDLTLPRFGLEEVPYLELCRRVDTVIHAAALVNHALSYEHLFEPNVLGTAEVARFALLEQRKPVHFVSTVGVAAGARSPVPETARAGDLWSRRRIRSRSTDYAAGYATSKWASELLLEDVHETCGLPVTISRCGMILPHPTYDAPVNESDAFVRLLYGIVRTGLAPVSFYGDGFDGLRHYDGLPVDLVAAFVAGLALRERDGLQSFHVSNAKWDDGVSLDTIVDWTTSAGYAIERLPYPRWYDAFRARLEGLPEAEKGRSPFAILHRYEAPTRVEALRLETAGFEKKLAEMANRTVASLDESYIHHCLRAIIDDGR